jgi:hypothetical protein
MTTSEGVKSRVRIGDPYATSFGGVRRTPGVSGNACSTQDSGEISILAEPTVIWSGSMNHPAAQKCLHVGLRTAGTPSYLRSDSMRFVLNRYDQELIETDAAFWTQPSPSKALAFPRKLSLTCGVERIPE